MRKLQILTSLALFALLAPYLHAQTGDWNAVENLAPGTSMSVKGRGHFHLMCTFVQANDDRLVCARPAHYQPILTRRFPFPVPTPIQGPYYFFDRRQIRDVRLEHSRANNALIGAAVVGGAFAAVGANSDSGTLTRGGGAILCGLIGGLIGGVFGRDFPLFHRKVIYRR